MVPPPADPNAQLPEVVVDEPEEATTVPEPMNPIEMETASPETEDPVPMNPIETTAPSLVEDDLVEPTDTIVDEEPFLPEDTPDESSPDASGGSETQTDNSTSAAFSAPRFAFALAATFMLPFLV